MLGVQFLYPSEEETCELLRFLLDNLSGASSSKARIGRKGRGGSKVVHGGVAVSETLGKAKNALSLWLEESKHGSDSDKMSGQDIVGTSSANLALDHVPFRTSPLWLGSKASGRKIPPLITLQAKPKSTLVPSVLELNAKDSLSAVSLLDERLVRSMRNASLDGVQDVKLVTKGALHIGKSSDGARSSPLERTAWSGINSELTQVHRDAAKNSTEQADVQDNSKLWNMERLEENLSNLLLESVKVGRETEELEQRVKEAEADHEASHIQLAALKRKHLVLGVAADMALDTSVSEELKIEKVKTSMMESQEQLAHLKLEWESYKAELDERKSSLEQSANSGKGGLQSLLKQAREIRQQLQEVSSKLKQREQQVISLSIDGDSSAKGPLRSTYVRRITALIKNSRKQDTDISCIIDEMRDLQRESNANQGRLKRTHAVVDELIFRDARNDPVCRQAYRMLSSLHENFADCYEKLLTMDKVRREIAELKATLETSEKLPVDLQKVQSDLDAVVAENKSLEEELAVIKNVK